MQYISVVNLDNCSDIRRMKAPSSCDEFPPPPAPLPPPAQSGGQGQVPRQTDGAALQVIRINLEL